MEHRDSYSCGRKLRLAPIPLRDGTFLLKKTAPESGVPDGTVWEFLITLLLSVVAQNQYII